MKKLKYAFLVLGVIFLFILVKKIGVETLWQYLKSVGWKTCLQVFIISLTWNILYTVAWQLFLKSHGGHISFFALLRIKMAGEAVNTITPANFLGGDPVRIYLLKKYYRWSAGAASVVVDRTLHAMATILIVILGSSLAFWKLDSIPQNIKVGLPIILSVFIVFVAFIFLHQRRGFFTFLMDCVKRLGIKREFSSDTIRRFEELDTDISEFYLQNTRGFWAAFGLHIVGRTLGIVEIFAIGYAASSQFRFFDAWILGALAPLINAIFTFIPGAMGVMEGAYAATLYFLGLPSSIGIVIQIIRRIRAAVWITLGLGALTMQERKQLLEHSSH